MALAKRRLLRKPLLRTLIILIRLLIPSSGPLLTFRMIALRIPHRCVLMVLAAALTGSSRDTAWPTTTTAPNPYAPMCGGHNATTAGPFP